MSDTETVEIKNRFTGDVMFTAQVEAGLSKDRKLGAAVRLAVKADAVLADANLAGANLAGANLSGAYLAGADLALDCGTPHGWRVVVVAHKDGIRIVAGCRWLTFSAAVEHWRGREDRKLMPPLLDYIKAAAEIHGWKLEG